MDLVELFEMAKVVMVAFWIFVFAFMSITVIFGRGEFSDKVIYPWEVEERRAAKKAAKAKKKEERRQAKRWRRVEKQYR